MREYKFRGKRIDNGEWVYGNLIYDNIADKYWIDLSINESEKIEGGLHIYAVEVDPNTVGQYTGLHDKNGKEINGGDIVKIPNDYEKFGVNAGELYEVYFAYGGYRLKPKYKKKARGYWLEDDNELEVIGNTTENPDLLEVQNEQ